MENLPLPAYFPDILGGPGPLFLLLLAMALDAAAGDWLGRVLPDPAGWARRQCGEYDRRLNKQSRGDRARLIRGLLLVLGLIGLAAGLGLAVEWLAGRLRGGWLAELVLLLGCLRARAAWTTARRIGRALTDDSLAAARDAVAPYTRRHALNFDQYAVARAALEHLARAFVRRVVAPAFWYVLLGLPGVLALAVVEGADAAVGRPGVRHERFGLTAATLDDALNALPARLAAILLGLAAPFLSGDMKAAFAAMFSDGRKAASLNMGWPAAALAGALGLALGGPHRDGGVTIDEPWLGTGRARVTPQDIDRGLALTIVATLWLALLLALLLLAVAGW